MTVDERVPCPHSGRGERDTAKANQPTGFRKDHDKWHGAIGGGLDSRNEPQTAKTCILRQRPDLLESRPPVGENWLPLGKWLKPEPQRY